MAASSKTSKDGATTEENGDDVQRVQNQLDELRQQLRGTVAKSLPRANDEDVEQTVKIVLQLPGDIFNRPNLSKLTF